MTTNNSYLLEYFRLLLRNSCMEFPKTLQEAEARTKVICQFCVFRSDPYNMITAMASDWMTHFIPLQQLYEHSRIFYTSFAIAAWNFKTQNRKQVLKLFYKDCLLQLDPSLRMVPKYSDWMTNFRLLLNNSAWSCILSYRKIWLKTLNQFFFLRPDSYNKMTAKGYVC